MSQYRRLLVVLDPSLKRTPALRRAEQLARATRAELVLCLFDHHAGIAAVGLVNREVMDLARRSFESQRLDWLRDQVVNLRNVEVTATAQLIWGASVQANILAKVAELKPDLVIKDAHVDGRAHLSALDWNLLRLCPAPLLLVQQPPQQRPRRVVAAVDPLPGRHTEHALNERIVAAALGLALQCDAQLHLVHAFDGLPAMVASDVAYSHVAFQQAYDALRLQHVQAFDDFARRLGVPVECRHVLEGDVAQAIGEFASADHTDIVVIGAGRQPAMLGFVLGRTAERLLEQLRCDVLVVKPEDFSLPAVAAAEHAIAPDPA